MPKQAWPTSHSSLIWRCQSFYHKQKFPTVFPFSFIITSKFFRNMVCEKSSRTRNINTGARTHQTRERKMRSYIFLIQMCLTFIFMPTKNILCFLWLHKHSSPCSHESCMPWLWLINHFNSISGEIAPRNGESFPRVGTAEESEGWITCWDLIYQHWTAEGRGAETLGGAAI